MLDGVPKDIITLTRIFSSHNMKTDIKLYRRYCFILRRHCRPPYAQLPDDLHITWPFVFVLIAVQLVSHAHLHVLPTLISQLLASVACDATGNVPSHLSGKSKSMFEDYSFKGVVWWHSFSDVKSTIVRYFVRSTANLLSVVFQKENDMF